jgi:hypothetical protein
MLTICPKNEIVCTFRPDKKNDVIVCINCHTPLLKGCKNDEQVDEVNKYNKETKYSIYDLRE